MTKANKHNRRKRIIQMADTTIQVGEVLTNTEIAVRINSIPDWRGQKRTYNINAFKVNSALKTADGYIWAENTWRRVA